MTEYTKITLANGRQGRLRVCSEEQTNIIAITASAHNRRRIGTSDLFSVITYNEFWQPESFDLAFLNRLAMRLDITVTSDASSPHILEFLVTYPKGFEGVEAIPAIILQKRGLWGRHRVVPENLSPDYDFNLGKFRALYRAVEISR